MKAKLSNGMERLAGALTTRRAVRLAYGSFYFLVLIAVMSNAFALRTAQQAQRDVREGAAVARMANCAGISAVIDAGRATILNGGRQLPPRLARNMRRLGYTEHARRRSARAAARTYARLIAIRVQESTGRTDLVEPDGSLNCDRLKQVANP